MDKEAVKTCPVGLGSQEAFRPNPQGAHLETRLL